MTALAKISQAATKLTAEQQEGHVRLSQVVAWSSLVAVAGLLTVSPWEMLGPVDGRAPFSRHPWAVVVCNQATLCT